MDEKQPEFNESPIIKKTLYERLKEKWISNWRKTDELCPICHQVTKRTIGFTRQSMIRLFIGKPNMYDWIFLFIIIMTLFMANQYNIETAQARYSLNNLDTICMQRFYPEISNNNSRTIMDNLNLSIFNLTNVT